MKESTRGCELLAENGANGNRLGSCSHRNHYKHLMAGKQHLMAGKQHLMAGKQHLMAGKQHLIVEKQHLMVGKKKYTCATEKTRSRDEDPDLNKAPEQVKVYFKKLHHARSLELPAYATAGSAGLDLRAALEHPLILKPGERALVPTGLEMALPSGYEAQIRPRSGLALKYGVTMLNTPGTIDSDYRGEIKVIAINLGQQPFEIRHGDRIAQMVVSAITRAEVEQCDYLPESSRGTGGFGSTGKT